MVTGFAATSTSVLDTLGQFRWLRAHISTFCLGAVVFICANLLLGGSNLWALTAIGIWIMLLLVHVIVIAIARLSSMLLADDEEEVVMLPIQEAVIVEPAPDPAATWATAEPGTPPLGEPEDTSEKIPWSIATDVAQARRSSSGEQTE